VADPISNSPLAPISTVTGGNDPGPLDTTGRDVRFDKDQKLKLQDFENYLNQQTMSFVERLSSERIFDAANQIGNSSVYLKPGESKPV
jgi:hypothetical protein